MQVGIKEHHLAERDCHVDWVDRMRWGTEKLCLMQVEIKEHRLSGLHKEIGQITDELMGQRDRCKDADQMLAKEKVRTDGVRAELKGLKEQLSTCKTKLGESLRETAEANVKANGMWALSFEVNFATVFGKGVEIASKVWTDRVRAEVKGVNQQLSTSKRTPSGRERRQT
jgi:hypothetical protein